MYAVLCIGTSDNQLALCACNVAGGDGARHSRCSMMIMKYHEIASLVPSVSVKTSGLVTRFVTLKLKVSSILRVLLGSFVPETSSQRAFSGYFASLPAPFPGWGPASSSRF